MTTLQKGVIMDMNEVNRIILDASTGFATAHYLLGSHVEYADITWRIFSEDDSRIIETALREVERLQQGPCVGGTGKVVLASVTRNGTLIYLNDESYASKKHLEGGTDTL